MNDLLIFRWRDEANELRKKARLLRSKPERALVTIACLEARADECERLIAELQLADAGHHVPNPGVPWIEAEVKQRQNEKRDGL